MGVGGLGVGGWGGVGGSGADGGWELANKVRNKLQYRRQLILNNS